MPSTKTDDVIGAMKEESAEPFLTSSYFIPVGDSQKANVTEPNRSCVENLTCSYSEKRCCCCKCSWKCCGISTFVVTLVVGLAIGGFVLYVKSRMTGTASSKDSKLWEERLSEADANLTIKSTQKLAKSILDGTYELVSYSKDYPDYLASMGIPGFVVSLILSSREMVTITQPETPGGKWEMKTETDLMTRDSFFHIGEPFEMTIEMGPKKGIMVTNCTLSGADENILDCDILEKLKQDRFNSKSVFTRAGFINTRTLVDKGISAKKYYQRVSKLEKLEHDVVAKDDELAHHIEMASPSPKQEEKLFSDNGDDPFADFDSDWDDDFEFK